jgi:tRNA(fMet)-specific endonuclease VapC
MIYLIDTNTCIIHLNRRVPSLCRLLEAQLPSDIAVCSVVKAEMFYGAMKSNNPERSLAKQERFLSQFVSLPFDDRAARMFGEIRANLAAKGTSIGAYDLQIAAIALVNNLILVTHNVREFSRVDGLRFEDWEVKGS